MFDEKSRAILVLGVLNDVFADVRNIIYYLQDFIASHPDWKEDFERIGLNEVLEAAMTLERLTLEKMNELKKIVET
ncbi:MAG: hypothetical protein ABWW66_05415 [Archaeoglobaceae archaeon]